jgi:hypothetical protein
MIRIDAVCQEAAGAFVTQIVPVQVNLLQLLAIDSDAMLGALGVVSVRDQEKRFPGGVTGENSIRPAEGVSAFEPPFTASRASHRKTKKVSSA